MLDRNLIRHQPDLVKQRLQAKGADPSLVDSYLDLDARWRAGLAEVEQLKAERNRVSSEVGKIKSQGGDAGPILARMGEIKERIQTLDDETGNLDAQITDLMRSLPNLPHETAPMGAGEADNVVRRTWGEPKQFEFEAKPHWELAETHDIVDFARGAKIAGSGFIVYKGLGARLERSLINFMLDTHTNQHGYTEVFPPFLVNEASYIGTGQFPKFVEEVYSLRDDPYHLISTAEVPVTNLYRDEILEGEALPIYHAAYSACFRREAGAAGKDTRGLLRVHEFNKVELVKFTLPETSYDEMEKLCANAETILQKLGIAYRVVELCTADLSFSAAKCYDLEIWSPGTGKWLEVSSCSNFEDFQARRANIRFRRETGAKPEFVHTLNASGVALPRLVACLLETYQQADGSILLPEPLRGYMGADKIG